MSPQAAKTIILLVGGFMFAAIGIKKDQITDPYRYAWAAGVILVGLSFLADIAPEVAGPFAILLLMAVYWKNRGVLGSLPGFAGTGTKTAGTTGTATSTVSKPFGTNLFAPPTGG